jgi:hypothetical protein
MKRYLFLAILLFSSQSLFAQWNLSGAVGVALNRVDQAFRSGTPNTIADMLASPVTLRLADSLHIDIAGMQAAELLNNFFAAKQVIAFNTGLPGSGSLVYTEGGKRDTTRVDIYLQRDMGGPTIRSLNISNDPMATMFFDLRKESDKTR